ncbi:hypothetical protein H310_08798 [Aphanomyces invadans]|uniref:Uncharacterized protein n=1 Tax=Aphanomyces invadans TaxID=157072 RepID=A0A024TZB1_9STRA|nr:hypothetical protein H310_08798 [Aphanomyces invadans]ETV98702.1 hypothetical protein H310_08798 [Aphanomyces invadans]|eukprot:XP_008872899.1 hypothetical protein H310_08798 [Aphanomyces invadans]
MEASRTPPSYGLCVPAGSYLETATPVLMCTNDCMTWECLVKPPQMPRVAVWVVVHRRFAFGIFKGYGVMRVGTQVYVTASACAMENTVKHWAGTFRTANDAPTLCCNDEFIDLERLEQVRPLCVNEAIDLAEPTTTADNHIRIGWTSKPNRMREARVHLVVSEFRVWRGWIPQDVLATWKLREVNHTHPYVVNLAAYWRLNDQSHRRYQLDLSGSRHDLHLVGFDDVRWVLLHPLHVHSTNPVLHLQFHQQPLQDVSIIGESSSHCRHMRFAVDVACHDCVAPSATKTHVVVVLDTAGHVDTATLTPHDRDRTALALQQFVAKLPAHTDVAILARHGIVLKWRRMDGLGRREATKIVKAAFDTTPTRPPSSDRSGAAAVEMALDLVASECHNVASTSEFWTAAVVVVATHSDASVATMATARLQQLWALVQHFTRVSHVVLTGSSSSLDSPATPHPATIAHNVVEYAYAQDDIEWVLSDILFKAMHAVCHSVQVQILSTGDDNVHLELHNEPPGTAITPSASSPSEMQTRLDTAVALHEYAVEIGVMAATDRVHFSGSFTWTQPTRQSIEVHVQYRVCGAIVVAASFVAIPPYAMVKQLTQLIMQSSPSGKAAPIDKDHEIAACRADARRVDTLYHHRNAFLEQLNDVDTSNAQKHFEQLRAAKEAFRQRFQAFDDDVVSFVHEHDVKILVDECSRALRPPKVVAKKAMPVFVYQDSHLGGMEKTTEAATPPAPCAGQWIEPLALLQAKGRIEDADVEFTESVKCLRLVDDDLKRTDNVFITPSEIELQLDTWLGRLRATRRARTDIAPRLIEHARGGKAVLFRRMQAHREMRTASDVSEIDQVVPAVQGRLGARKATDAAAIDRLQPAVAAELAGFVKAELAWTHARFTDTTLKDKPIPRDMLPFSTFVWCPCDRPSVQNALLALVFALRTSRQRGQPEVALCPPVHVHDRPLWLQQEQLPQDMEGVDDIVAAQQTLLADAWRLCGQVLFVTGSFLTSTTALDDAVTHAIAMKKHVWHIQLDARAASIVRQTSLPAPVNTTMLDVDATFVCDDCRSLRPETLVASPCHQCTFRRPQDNPAFAALVSEVASMLQQPVPHGLQSPPPSTRLTQLAPALYQLRKSHAERQWLHNKAAHADLAAARVAGVVEFERHVFDRYAQDVDDLVTIQASLQQLKQAKQRHSRSTVVGFDVQCAGLGVALATTTSRIAWLRDQMLCLEEDAVGRMQRATDLAAGTLLPYRALIKSLQELCGQYTAVNDQCYAALQDSIVHEAEIAFVKQLTDLEQAQDAIVTSCISSWELQVASMLETITAAAPAEDAHKLFSAAMAPVFTFVPSVAPCNFDGEWLQRAVTDLQVHEKHVLDRIEDGFVHAKHLDSIRAHATQLDAAKARFEATYGVRSDVAAEAIPLDVPCAILRDVAWTRPDQAMDVEEAWASIHAMAARVQDETMDRRKKYLHSRCCILFLQVRRQAAYSQQASKADEV